MAEAQDIELISLFICRFFVLRYNENMFGFVNIAQAHLIGGSGLASGVTHPLLGWDHVLAMVAVGIISTQIGGRAIWKVPATFVSFMVVGGLLATSGFAMPIAQTGIALSVLIFGVVIAFSKKIPINAATVCVALFAIFHGHTHGEEIPLIASPALYTAGFVLSTTALHIMGVLIGHAARKTKRTLALLRYAGAGVSLIGLLFL